MNGYGQGILAAVQSSERGAPRGAMHPGAKNWTPVSGTPSK